MAVISISQQLATGLALNSPEALRKFVERTKMADGDPGPPHIPKEVMALWPRFC